MKHYLLIKRDGLSAGGSRLDATECALALLKACVWPLWNGTPNNKRIAAGDHVAVYLAGPGEGRVIARATVANVGAWTRDLARGYPLMLDGTPARVLHLNTAEILQRSIDVRERLPRLSFVKQGVRKWGVYFIGGTRAVPPADFNVLTSSTPC